MNLDWSRIEVEVIVADYLDMLMSELKGQPYNKAEHRRRLQPLLSGRSEGSIERKHMNISAVMIELGFPYIPGYKRYGNYQRLLYEVVSERVAVNQDLISTVKADVESEVEVPTFDDILKCLVAPPDKPDTSIPLVQSPRTFPYGHPVNYLEKEARNMKLGNAGEEYAFRYEQARLASAGQERLASKIDHISKTKGDNAGFDILSYEIDGQERLIEVKTTKYGVETPFYLSRNEVVVSANQDDRYHLYRLFSFSRRPKLFVLDGALEKTCVMEPQSYRAVVGVR